MSSRRTLILVGAIVVGALAAFLILRYVSSVEDKANADNQLVPVLVVTSDIAQGEKADGAIEEKKIDVGERRRIDLPPNAVYRFEDIKGQNAAIRLLPGDIVTTSNFVNANDLSSSNSKQLEKGMVAVTVSVDQARGVSGLVQPGDYVNVFLTSAAGESQSADIMRSALVYQKVRVLAIGKDLGTPVAAPAEGNGAAAPAATQGSDLVTLEVPPDAAVLVSAVAQKNLVLGLVRSDYEPRPIPNVNVGPEQLPGQNGSTPYDGLPAGTPGANGDDK